MILLCVPELHRHNAIGEHVLALARLSGATVFTRRISFLPSAEDPSIVVDPTLARLPELLGHARKALWHFGGFDSLFDLVGTSACPHVLCFHGLTPPELLAPQGPDFTRNQKAREQLASIVPGVGEVWTDSLSARRELETLLGLTLPHWRLNRLLGLQLALPEARRVARSARYRFVFSGRISRAKGLDLLPSFAHALRAGGVEADIHVVGNAAETDFLRTLQKALAPLAPAVRCDFTGRLSTARLQQLYLNSDALFLPSRHEGFGIPLVEAVSHGCAVIARASTAMPETLARLRLAEGQAFLMPAAADGEVFASAEFLSWLRALPKTGFPTHPGRSVFRDREDREVELGFRSLLPIVESSGPRRFEIAWPERLKLFAKSAIQTLLKA